MPSKSTQGRIGVSTSFLSNNSGKEGSLRCIKRNGDIYLGYKIGTSWYYTRLDKNISALTNNNILERKIPRAYGEISIFDNKVFVKNKSSHKELILNNSNVHFKGKSIRLSGSNGVGGLGSSVSDGAMFHIEASNCFNVGSETGETVSQFNTVKIENPTVHANSSAVTTTVAANLHLGSGPIAGDNMTFAAILYGGGRYSLSLDGNIKSSDLTIVDSGDIHLNAQGGDVNLNVLASDGAINFKTPGAHFGKIGLVTGASRFQLFENQGASAIDHFIIDCKEHGATDITTVDAAGVNADISLIADGDITLDAATGIFKLRDSGDLNDAFHITVVGGTGATTLETVSAAADGHLSLVSDGDTIIDSAGTITLDAASSAGTYFKEGGTKFGAISAFGSFSRLTLYENGGVSTDDMMDLRVGVNGVTTLETIDTAGTGADLTFDIDGDITLDSATGVFEMHGPGTVSKFADMYAGMILGYTALNIDAADASYTTTTSMAVVHSTTKITFVAPPSGKVEIFVSVYVDTTAGRPLVFGLSDNGTYSPIDFPNSNDVTNEHVVYIGDETDEEQVNHQWVVEGLTVGTSYTWYFGVKSAPTVGAYVLRFGGNVSSEYAPFIMKATALPATIYDGT